MPLGSITQGPYTATSTRCPNGPSVAQDVCVIRYDLAKASFAFSTNTSGDLVATGSVPVIIADVPYSMSISGPFGTCTWTGYAETDLGAMCTPSPTPANVAVTITVASTADVNEQNPPVFGCTPVSLISVLLTPGSITAGSASCGITNGMAICAGEASLAAAVVGQDLTGRYPGDVTTALTSSLTDAINGLLCAM